MDALRQPIRTQSPQETIDLGFRLGKMLNAGDVLALYGEMGSGKTHLTQGISSALGIDRATVTSPTFTLVNEYSGPSMTLYHFDAYRIEDISEYFELGYEDYFFGEGVCILEWPERVEPLLPGHTIRLQLTHLGENTREFRLIDTPPPQP